MPTGTPIGDIDNQLFQAAERVLARDGPDALTSRAVTTEADVAKGILHRYFSDFDAFLAALALTHIERIDSLTEQLRAAAGTGTVSGNLAGALAAALDAATIRTVSLVCFRQRVLARLRLTTRTGVPVLAETAKMIAVYLTAERGLGRIAITTDVDALAVLLVGGAHLRAFEADDLALSPDDVLDLVEVGIDETPQNRTSTEERHRSH